MEASNDLTVNAGNNISSTAATDITTNAGANLKMDAGSNVDLGAGSNLSAKAGSKASFKGDKSATIFAKRVSITGMIMTNIQSGAIMSVMTLGVLNLTGAARNLINGAKVVILGERVELND